MNSESREWQGRTLLPEGMAFKQRKDSVENVQVSSPVACSWGTWKKRVGD